MIQFLVFLYLMHPAVSFSFQNIQPGCQIDNTAILGQFINIGPNVIIKYNAEIGDFAQIASQTMVGENTQIGSYSNIGQHCIIANDVIINNYAKIGNHNTIGPGCILSGFISTGNNVKFGKSVKVNQYAAIEDGVVVGDGDFLDQYSRVGPNVEIAPKAYIGMFSSIHPNATVNALAVIHKFVEIPRGATVKFKEVIIRSPSSAELYEKCFSIENLSAAQIETAANNIGSNADFNNLLRGLIESQMNDLSTSCEQTNFPPNFQKLSSIKSLYLIRYHGVDRFKQNLQQVQESRNGVTNTQVFINGVRMDCTQSQVLRRQLENEYHFDENSGREILEPDVKKNMIKLLVSEEDEKRGNRIENDTFCSMFDQIRTGEREVTCAKRNNSRQSGTNYC